MPGLWQRLFHRVRVVPLRLEFSLDQGSDDRHVVRVRKVYDDRTEDVVEVEPLLRYGYREESPDGGRVYVLSKEDWQTLQAVQSLHPQGGENGAIVFEVLPPVLAYLRRRQNLQETPASQQVIIETRPLQPAVDVDFAPEVGVRVQAGYRAPDGPALLPKADLRLTADGRWARLGDRFVPLPSPLSDLQRHLIDRGEDSVSLQSTPQFFLDQLPRLRAEFDTTLSPSAAAVQVDPTPLKPEVRIDFHPETGVDLRAGYRSGGDGDAELVKQTDLKTTADGRWAFGSRFVALPDSLSAAHKELLATGSRHLSIPEVPEFFQRDLVLLHTGFEAVLSDSAANVNVIADLRPVFHLDHPVPSWLSYNVGYEAGDAILPHHDLLALGDQTYYRLGPDTWIKVSRPVVDRVEAIRKRLHALSEHGDNRIPVHAFATLEDFIAEVGGRSVVSTAYEEFLDQLVAFQEDDDYRLSPAAEARLQEVGVTLRPYQRGGIGWLVWLSRHGLHGVLADDMGLGKTLQAIAALRLAYEHSTSHRHSLVITPKSVLYHWERELQRSYPEIQICVYHGSKRRRDLLHSTQPTVFISTYATVVNDIASFSQIPLLYLVLDEATQIKNPGAVRTSAVKSLNATHRLALTGTPVENRPAELWSLFDFLMRGHLGRQGTFQVQFEAPILAGDQKTAERLGRRIRPFMLRRTKGAVARDLPDKVEVEEWCELTDEQRQLYGAIQERSQDLIHQLNAGSSVSFATSILPVLTYLLQVCDHPAIINGVREPLVGRSEKYDWVVATIDAILAGKEQVVVFSRFLDMLSLLERAMQDRAVPTIRIDGSTNNRQALIDHFNAGKAKVAICSTLAAGHGINLTAANHVIHADRWWNPAVEEQATDRVHRIGQDRTVYVHRIITGGTLEERLDQLLRSKRGMADRIMNATAGSLEGWTRAELVELLRPLD